MDRQLSGLGSSTRSHRGLRHWFWTALAILSIGSLLLLVAGFAAAASDPVVRRTRIHLSDWPDDQRTLKVVLVSDIHVAGPDMPPKRVERLVGLINRLRPDVVVLAGDFVSDKRVSTRQYSIGEAIAPLKGFQAPLGSLAVLGNHDHWRDADQARAALRRADITVLNNNAIKVGPLVVGGLDDDFTGKADLRSTIARMRRLKGPKLLISHSPDPFPEVPKDIQLMLAGHTHCGQIVLPQIGALSTMSRYGDRYACGIVRQDGKTLIVGAGLGTSILPLRLGAPPDLWLIEVAG